MLPESAATPVAGAPKLTRRGFLGWARNGVIAAAALSILGGAALTSTAPASVDAKESEDSKSEKKSKSSSSEKSNKTRTKKKKKNKNKTTATSTPTANSSTISQSAIDASPYGKYIVLGQDKFNCTDFKSQADAQGTLRLVPKDPNNLDRNRDGIACGGAEAFQDGVPGGFMMPPYDIVPVSRP